MLALDQFFWLHICNCVGQRAKTNSTLYTKCGERSVKHLCYKSRFPFNLAFTVCRNKFCVPVPVDSVDATMVCLSALWLGTKFHGQSQMEKSSSA